MNANHASYLQGFSGWSRHLALQLTFQFRQDGSAGALGLGLGMIAAGMYRWTAARRSTWNTRSADATPSTAAGEVIGAWQTPGPSLFVLIRFVAAGLALTMFALRMSTPLMLSCTAISGFGGMYLWPVLRRIWLRRRLRDLSPTAEGAAPLTPGDLESAPTIDPALGLCTTFCWFVGLLVTTPLYHPYARLFFPLLASIFLAAAGGAGWWVESHVSVARRPRAPGSAVPRKSWADHLVTSMLAAALLLSFVKFDEKFDLKRVEAADLFHSTLFADRTSIVRAANQAADLCVLSARGELPPSAPALPVGTTIRPEDVAGTSDSRPVQPELTVDARRSQRLVVCVFGEPALLLHLRNAGVAAIPVSHLNLLGPDGSTPTVPTFVIIGPNAKRTPDFWEAWMERIKHFQAVGNVPYRPSEATLLDLFSPAWLDEHNEAAVQTFEVHRVQ